MGHQVLDREVAGRGIGFVHRAGRVLEHSHARELGQPLGDRIVEFELAFLPQYKGRKRGDRLGHGRDAEQGVAGHRQARLDVTMADGVNLDDLALAPDQGDEAGEVTGVDHRLQRRRDLGQARLNKPAARLIAVHARTP